MACWQEQLCRMSLLHAISALGVLKCQAVCKVTPGLLLQVWHPDKHPDNKEEATERFQKIAKAYDSLMLTEEDARIEALGHK